MVQNESYWQKTAIEVSFPSQSPGAEYVTTVRVGQSMTTSTGAIQNIRLWQNNHNYLQIIQEKFLKYCTQFEWIK